MKKILFLFSLFTIIACSNDDVIITLFEKSEKMYEEAIEKVRDAESIGELEAIDDWVDDKLDILEAELESIEDNYPDQFEVADEQIKSGKGKYYDLNEKTKLLRRKYEGLWDKRYKELY